MRELINGQWLELEQRNTDDSAAVRCLELLWELSTANEPMTINQVVGATGMTRATAYRTLDQLAKAGWLTVAGWPRRFQPSIRVAQLGIKIMRSNRARHVTLSHTINCARATGRACVIAFYDDGYSVYTDVVHVLGEKVTILPRGERIPAACTSVGRVLLAHQSDAEVERVLNRGIPRINEDTNTNVDEVRKDIEVCRRRGYAIVNREAMNNSSLATPVFSGDSSIAAAMAVIVGPPINDVNLERYLTPLSLHSTSASAELGYHDTAYADAV